MLLGRNKNPRSNGSRTGSDLKTPVITIKLSRLKVLRKLTHKISTLSFVSRVSLGLLLVLYFAGYQPTLAIPPIKKAVVEAEEFTQQQTINSNSLSHGFSLPHPGYLSQRFSPWHPGIDVATGLGMPVHPVNNGKVIEVVYGYFGFGHYVAVEHEQGYKSTYGHMGRIFVTVGDEVNTGSIMGEVGMTGRTTGPHTHLEITKNGQYVDPLTLLPDVPTWPKAAGKAPQGQGQITHPVKLATQPNIPQPVKEKITPTPKLPTIEMKQLGFANQQEALKVTELPHLLLSQ